MWINVKWGGLAVKVSSHLDLPAAPGWFPPAGWRAQLIGRQLGWRWTRPDPGCCLATSLAGPEISETQHNVIPHIDPEHKSKQNQLDHETGNTFVYLKDFLEHFGTWLPSSWRGYNWLQHLEKVIKESLFLLLGVRSLSLTKLQWIIRYLKTLKSSKLFSFLSTTYVLWRQGSIVFYHSQNDEIIHNIQEVGVMDLQKPNTGKTDMGCSKQCPTISEQNVPWHLLEHDKSICKMHNYFNLLSLLTLTEASSLSIPALWAGSSM